MPARRALQTLVAIGLMAALVMTSAHPASAVVTLHPRPFAMWPPSYCAKSAGAAAYLGDNVYGMGTVTSSMRAGPDGVCDDPSSAPANTFSAMPRLQVYFEPSGGWVVCRDELYLRVVNAHGAWLVQSEHTVFGCGAVPHRLWSGSRITYGGIDHHDDRYTGVL